MTDILFHLKTREHGYLSNFYAPPRPILLDGKEWATSEHYYQAQKFVTIDPAWAEAIRTAQGPYVAWQMAKDPAHARRQRHVTAFSRCVARGFRGPKGES